MKKKFYVGIDIGGTQIKIGIVDSNANIMAQSAINTPSVDKLSEFLNPIVDETIQLVKKVKQNSKYDFVIKTVGVGVPGIADNKTGEILYCKNVAVLSESNFASELQKTFDAKTLHEVSDSFKLKSVQIGNDAKNAALAEIEKGALSGAISFELKDKVALFLTIGTGIGGTVIRNGEVLFDKAEPGHIYLQNSVFEGLASTEQGLVHFAREELRKNPNSMISKEWKNEIENAYNEGRPAPKLDAKIILKAYDKGDTSAKGAFDKWIKNLSQGLTSLVDAYQAEYIVLGGGISNLGERLTKPLELLVNQNSFFNSINTNVSIVPAKFRNGCGIIGSAIMAKNNELQREQNNILKMRKIKSAPKRDLLY